jgi:hypothetical protein
MRDDSLFVTAGWVAFVVFMCILVFKVSSCDQAQNEVSQRASVERNEAAQRTAQACIASQRSASDCAVILGAGK